MTDPSEIWTHTPVTNWFSNELTQTCDHLSYWRGDERYSFKEWSYSTSEIIWNTKLIWREWDLNHVILSCYLKFWLNFELSLLSNNLRPWNCFPRNFIPYLEYTLPLDLVLPFSSRSYCESTCCYNGSTWNCHVIQFSMKK